MKKISIVIGGTKGIGKEIAKNLLDRGDSVIIISRNIKKKFNKVFSKAELISLDLSNPEDISNLSLKIKYKKFDNLIFSQRYRGSDEDEEYQVMLKSIYQVIDNLRDKMNKNSSIVIISSISLSGILCDQKLNYHVTKGGIDQLVKYLAVKLGQFKIRINAILATRAIKYENKKFYKKNNFIRKRIEKITPLKRMSSSKDIANVVNFLTENRSDYITGENIRVDGGLRLLSQEYIAELLNK
jgi:NAD(P)-dependent dehydrogenase (short-subunit alcohol dehydrogenase family)